jgi:hypothetical protein
MSFFVVEKIVLRAFFSMLADFLYLLLFLKIMLEILLGSYIKKKHQNWQQVNKGFDSIYTNLIAIKFNSKTITDIGNQRGRKVPISKI